MKTKWWEKLRSHVNSSVRRADQPLFYGYQHILWSFGPISQSVEAGAEDPEGYGGRDHVIH
ncbi:unnamed protein product [Brassica oleracea]|uniref:(rape) hypothetical protein n=1 Tax=Brassica napus TaxID=3708 RepID=A0A816LA60_BRANA|nr:unnamed protein product [Brassica napus]